MIAVGLLAALAAASTPCPIENARYRMHDNAVTARFRTVDRTSDWPAGVALEVEVSRPERSLWFLPWQGGTNQRTNVAQVRESGSGSADQPIRTDFEMFTTDADFRLDSTVPHAGQMAPAHLFILYLNEYDRSFPRAFLDLVACTPPAVHEPLPAIEFPPAG